MPRVTLPITDVFAQQSILMNTVAVDASMIGAGNGAKFLNDGSSVIYVINPSTGAPCTLSIVAVPDEAGRTGTDVTPTGYSRELAPGDTRFFGPYRQAWWNQTTVDTGYVYIDFTYAVPGAAANRVRIGILNY